MYDIADGDAYDLAGTGLPDGSVIDCCEEVLHEFCDYLNASLYEECQQLITFLSVVEDDAENLDALQKLLRTIHTLKTYFHIINARCSQALAYRMEALLQHMQTARLTMTMTVTADGAQRQQQIDFLNNMMMHIWKIRESIIINRDERNYVSQQHSVFASLCKQIHAFMSASRRDVQQGIN